MASRKTIVLQKFTSREGRFLQDYCLGMKALGGLRKARHNIFHLLQAQVK